MTEAQNDIQQMHGVYVNLTGFEIPLDMAREMAWYHVWKRGIRAVDLGLVIRHLQGQILAERRNPGCLKFRNLVGNPDYLEEDLAEARARARTPRVNPARAEVLQATGRPAAPEPPGPRRASDVLPPEEATRRLLEAMKQAREQINQPKGEGHR